MCIVALALLSILAAQVPAEEGGDTQDTASAPDSLMQKKSPGIKAALSLGGHSGGRLGVELNPNRTRHWQNFINLDALYNKADNDLVGGINIDFRKLGKSNYYPVFAAGLDVYPVSYQALTSWDLGGKGPVWESRRGKIVLPHLTAGLGYRNQTKDGSEFFAELDLGLSVQFLSLKLGFVF